jgi:hypothetical protein
LPRCAIVGPPFGHTHIKAKGGAGHMQVIHALVWVLVMMMVVPIIEFSKRFEEE